MRGIKGGVILCTHTHNFSRVFRISWQAHWCKFPTHPINLWHSATCGFGGDFGACKCFSLFEQRVFWSWRRWNVCIWKDVCMRGQDLRSQLKWNLKCMFSCQKKIIISQMFLVLDHMFWYDWSTNDTKKKKAFVFLFACHISLGLFYQKSNAFQRAWHQIAKIRNTKLEHLRCIHCIFWYYLIAFFPPSNPWQYSRKSRTHQRKLVINVESFLVKHGLFPFLMCSDYMIQWYLFIISVLLLLWSCFSLSCEPNGENAVTIKNCNALMQPQSYLHSQPFVEQNKNECTSIENESTHKERILILYFSQQGSG